MIGGLSLLIEVMVKVVVVMQVRMGDHLITVRMIVIDQPVGKILIFSAIMVFWMTAVTHSNSLVPSLICTV